MSLAKSHKGIHKDTILIRSKSQTEKSQNKKQEEKTEVETQHRNNKSIERNADNRDKKDEDKIKGDDESLEPPLCLDVSKEI